MHPPVEQGPSLVYRRPHLKVAERFHVTMACYLGNTYVEGEWDGKHIATASKCQCKLRTSAVRADASACRAATFACCEAATSADACSTKRMASSISSLLSDWAYQECKITNVFMRQVESAFDKAVRTAERVGWFVTDLADRFLKKRISQSGLVAPLAQPCMAIYSEKTLVLILYFEQLESGELCFAA